MTAEQQETLQIHLVPKSLEERARVHAELVATRTAAGSPPPEPLRPNFEFYSGRGVRYRMLTPDEKEQVTTTAAGLIGPTGTYGELNSRQALEGVKKTIVAVTRKTGLRTLDGLQEGDWQPLNDAMLAGLGSDAWKFERLFTTKDVAVLKALYNRAHNATEADVDEIEGKAISVISA